MSGSFKTLLNIDPVKNLNAYIQTSACLLKDLTKQGLITHGTVLHAHLIKMGISSEKYTAVKLLSMYLNFRKSAEADNIVKDFNGFNLVVHNCLIAANVNWGNVHEACRLFEEMPERNNVSWTALVSGLLKQGRVEEAMQYFYRNPFQSVFSWTAAISGLVQNGLNSAAMKLFFKMLKRGTTPNDVTFTSVIKACSELRDYALGMSVLSLIVKVGLEHSTSISNCLITFSLRLGNTGLARRIFDRMQNRDAVSWTAILDMYVDLGDLREARRIFDETPEKNEVTWSAMIARYSQGGYAEEAIELFHQMVQDGFRPNSSCFTSTISALASLGSFKAGSIIHGHVIKFGIERDVYVGSSLIDLYCRWGYTENGRQVFDSILEKNVVCWNAMVGGYSLNGKFEQAKELFDQIPKKNTASWNSLIAGYLKNEQCDMVFERINEMLMSGEMPDKSTLASVLCACANMASLQKGKNLHGKTIKLGYQFDIIVGTTLIDMYAKSGDIRSSKQVFDKIPKKNEICWTAMIQGLAENGFGEESLDLFEEMKRASSVKPNGLILLSVLFACSHCGLVDKGLWYFNSMEKIYGIKPINRHYTCVADMLSRSGRLSEAEKFLASMPYQPDVNAWAALLSGCKTYTDETIAEKVAGKLWELSESKAGGYVMLSNIYASAGRWPDVLNTRKLMKEKGMKKSGACSWLEVRNQLHLFYSQDGNHSLSPEIYGVLEILTSEMRKI